MASTHKSLRSSTADKRPTTSIADGQIALNTNAASPGLFFKDSAGTDIIKVGPVHVGTTAPNATPATGGSSGNSKGEVWLDTSLTPVGVKIWNGSSWENATPAGSTTVQGLLELATNAETQTGTDTARAVTPAGLQSKVSDSTSTTSSTTIASSTAVKSAYDLANAALPKTGGTITGALEIGTTGSLVFEGATANDFETTVAVTDPTADRTVTIPNQSGNFLISGNASIVNADVNASAAIAGTKISPNFGAQTLVVDTNVLYVDATTDRVGINTASPAAALDIAGNQLFSASNPQIQFNAGGPIIRLPSANTLAFLSDSSTERLRLDSSGNVGIGSTSPQGNLSFGASAAVINLDTSDGSDNKRLVLNGGGGGFSSGRGGYIALSGNEATNPGNVQITMGNVSGTGIVFNKGDGSEVGRWDSSGRLLVGTSNTSTTARALIQGTSGDPTGTGVLFVASGKNNPGSSEDLALLRFGDSGHARSAEIGVYRDGGTWTSGTSQPTRLTFSTTADGASSPTERLRIDSSGRVGIGITPAAKLDVSSTSGTLFRCEDSGVAQLNIGNGGNSINYYDADTQIFRSGGGSERLRIDSSGRLGVGTSSPAATLHSRADNAGTGSTPLLIQNRSISANTAVGISFAPNTSDTADRSAIIYGVNSSGGSGNATDLAFHTNANGGSPSEKVRIDSSGNFGIGVSSPGYRLDVQAADTTASLGYAMRLRENSTAGAATIQFTDSAVTVQRATITVDSSSNIRFGNSSERLRIDSSGRLGVGTSNPSVALHVATTGTPQFRLEDLDTANAYSNVSASNGNFVIQADPQNVSGATRIGFEIDGTERARIDNSGYLYINSMAVGGTANMHWSSSNGQLFVTSSSERFKHGITAYDKGLTELMQLEPKYFTYNDEPGQKQRAGFIAEDFHALGLTEYVEYWNDEDGNATVPSEIGYSNMVAILVKSIQEQQAMIETLQTKVAALEGN